MYIHNLLGGYLYVNANEGRRARIMSPFVTALNGELKCVEFFYNMYGIEVNQLQVWNNKNNNN